MFKAIRKTFITGFITLLPVVITIYVLFIVFNSIDSIFREMIYKIWEVEIPGLGIIVTFLFILLVGLISRHILGHKILESVERVVKKIPVARGVYFAIKQIIETIFMNNKNTFKSVVMIEYPKAGIYTLAFVTSEAPRELREHAGEELISLFIPTTPNPTSGLMVMVSKANTFPLKMTVEEGIRMIVSGGILTPDQGEITINK